MTLIVIVLGKRLEKAQISDELKGRLDIALKLFRGIKADYIILSGGLTNPEIQMRECDVMSEYMLQHGVKDDEILLETEALDTIGNAYYTRKIIDTIRYVEMIYVVSSCYHMPRVEFIFRQCYGNSYRLDFSYCFETAFDDRKESRSTEMAHEFFKGIIPGDLSAISKKLFSEHSLYNKMDLVK